MRTIETADRFGQKDLIYRDVTEAPFSVHGLLRENGRFVRLPEAVARATSEGVAGLFANTAGGRVRFATKSPYVAIHAEMSGIGKMGHFAPTGAAGFDLYADGIFAGAFIPPYDQTDGYDAILWLPGCRRREITVNFPLYSNVEALYIGLAEDAPPEKAAPYRRQLPIVFYGSSITQGGCASRPGLAYQSILSRALDADFLNLGFSGSCKAEEAITAYLRELEMSVFVYDYDHNAPDPDYLAATHEKLFLALRQDRPALPVVMLSRPKFTLNEDDLRRQRIVQATFDRARARGDENVRFLDGPALMALCGDEGTADGCHPNDLGFSSMAAALEKTLRTLPAP